MRIVRNDVEKNKDKRRCVYGTYHSLSGGNHCVRNKWAQKIALETDLKNLFDAWYKRGFDIFNRYFKINEQWISYLHRTSWIRVERKCAKLAREKHFFVSSTHKKYSDKVSKNWIGIFYKQVYIWIVMGNQKSTANKNHYIGFPFLSLANS